MASWIPQSERIPGVKQRVIPERDVGLVAGPGKVLLIGFRLSTADDSKDYSWRRIRTRTDSIALSGAGSQNDLMCRAATVAGALSRNDSVRGAPPEIWAMNVPPMTAGVGFVVATHTITLTGTATTSGRIIGYLADQTVSIPVAVGDTAADLAARLESEIETVEDNLPFTGGVASNVITMTAREPGAYGNEFVIYVDATEIGGITAAVAAGTAGEGFLDLTDALDASYAVDWDYIGLPQDDSATLALLPTHVENGWDYTRRRYAILGAACSGDLSDAMTNAASLDDYRITHPCAEKIEGAGPPPWDWNNSSKAFSFEVNASVGARLYSQTRANHNFNNASLSVSGRPRTVDRDVVNDAINAGVCVVWEPENGNARGEIVDPVTTAIKDQSKITTGPQTKFQPVECAKVAQVILRSIDVELAPYVQLDANEQTLLDVKAGCFSVLKAAERAGLIKEVDQDHVSAEYETVGAAEHLVVEIAYKVIVGLDIIPVTHRLNR